MTRDEDEVLRVSPGMKIFLGTVGTAFALLLAIGLLAPGIPSAERATVANERRCEADWQLCNSIADIMRTSWGSRAQHACHVAAEKLPRYERDTRGNATARTNGAADAPNTYFDSYTDPGDLYMKDALVHRLEVDGAPQRGVEAAVFCSYNLVTGEVVHLEYLPAMPDVPKFDAFGRAFERP